MLILNLVFLRQEVMIMVMDNKQWEEWYRKTGR
jgi:hypothetical protein